MSQPTFTELGLRPELTDALARRGISQPFPIQSASLPDSLAGRDVLGRGRTGSGKTIAFALPLLTRLLDGGRRRPRQPRALILAPTRELVVQIHETVNDLARPLGLTTVTVFGGVGYGPQVKKLAAGVDVCIATPGRLEDLIARGDCDLRGVEIAVLDEADMMSDMGFLPPVTRILSAMPRGQRMLFSATLDNDVAVIVRKFLHDPVTHSVDEGHSVPPMDQRLFLVNKENKVQVLADLASGAGKLLAFTRTKHGAARLAKDLTKAGIPALDLQGNLGQNARTRNLAAFSAGQVRVLVATDIAARGIHVDDVALVVHFDPPAEAKAFLHRSGRTARAGAGGVVITLCTRDQNKAVADLMRKAKITPTREVVAPGDALIADLRGPVTEPPVMVEHHPHPRPRHDGDAPPRNRTGGRPPRHRGNVAAPAGNRTRQGASRPGTGRNQTGAPRQRRSG